MQTAQPPYLDQHSTVIASGADDVWSSLLATLDRSFSRGAAAVYARLVGCADRTASGPRPLEPGSTIPGFRVATADSPGELVLEGRHRFSSYVLVFRIEPIDQRRAQLTAESRAAFPGIGGHIYRALLMRTGGHARAVRALLSRIRRRAERQPLPQPSRSDPR